MKAHIQQINVLSMLILPGNRYIVLGTKEGDLIVHDLQDGKPCHTVDSAHKKEIWELAMHSSPQIKDARGQLLIASASADHSIKFWNLAQSQSTGKVKLQFYEKIESTDEVMGVKFTSNGKYFIFSLLDQTIKVCYLDSMKLSLNLYGHNLPVLSFDVSTDDSLLVSCSADKNIKLWGLDFGDIHKSIFAHQDSITHVEFIKETHYFMSCSKDKQVKFYDGDTYDEVFVFDNFFGEVWGLACSSIGDFFVTVCADKCIRIWRQTKEQTFLIEQQDEREDKAMLKEAEVEYTEIDIAKQNQIDPFSKDKVVKIETQVA
jgi:U3 small nucleolar RNA-associated protein 12